MSTELPPWPKATRPTAYPDEMHEYEYDRAEAALARLKVAVEKLQHIQAMSAARVKINNGAYATHHEDYESISREALTAIGDIP